jgi:hypothetical protein
MSASEDRCGGLASQLVESQTRVVAGAQHRLPLFDEGSDERAQLVQSRAFPLDVLVERERQLSALLEVSAEDDERTEREPTQEWMEM